MCTKVEVYGCNETVGKNRSLFIGKTRLSLISVYRKEVSTSNPFRALQHLMKISCLIFLLFSQCAWGKKLWHYAVSRDWLKNENICQWNITIIWNVVTSFHLLNFLFTCRPKNHYLKLRLIIISYLFISSCTICFFLNILFSQFHKIVLMSSSWTRTTESI